MKINDIIKLAEAGFTKEDIAELMQIGNPAPQPAPQPEPQPAPQPTARPQISDAPIPNETVEQMLDRHFANLTAMLQNQAIHNMPVNIPTQEESVDAVLASIISPKGGEL